MAQTLDVYREWLGITDPDRPPNYYQLLRLTKFEDDAVRVRAHYRKMNAHVRKFASGDYATESQQLLNELAKAMLCLTDTVHKSEYDASLGRKAQEGPGRRTFEEILLLRKVIDRAQLEKARSYANTIGLEVRDALVQQKLAKPEVVMQIYAESLGLAYMDPADIALGDDLIKKVPAILARQHSCVPVMLDDDKLLMATPIPLKPEVEDELRLRTGVPVRTVLCTVASANEIINRHYPREAAAAEMAAGQQAPSSAKTEKAGAASKPAASPEDTRQMLMILVITFNFTFFATTYLLWQAFFPIFSRNGMPVGRAMGFGAVAGAIAAGIAYVAVRLRRS